MVVTLRLCFLGIWTPALDTLQWENLLRMELWYRDPATSPCGALFNLTNGVQVLFTP